MPSDEEKKSKKSKKTGSKKPNKEQPDHQWWVPDESGEATHWWETPGATAGSGTSQPAPIDSTPIPVVPDVGLQIKKTPAAARIQRPNANAGQQSRPTMSAYQRAKSDRNLPSAPPPPVAPPAPMAAGRASPGPRMNMTKAQSVRLPSRPAPAGFAGSSQRSMQAPAPVPRMQMKKASSARLSNTGAGLQAPAPGAPAPAPVPRMQMKKASSVRLPNTGAGMQAPAPAPMSRMGMNKAQSVRLGGGAMTPPPPPTTRGMGMKKAQSVRIGSSGSFAPPPPPPGAPPPNDGLARIPSFRGGMQAPAAPRGMGMTKAQSVRIGSSGSTLTPPPPPPPVVAEGVPLVPTKAKKEKKDKKKKEDKPEVFQDEPEDDDLSISEHNEKLDAWEKAELDEQKVRKSLCFAILSACGLICMLQIISRLIARASGNGDDYIDADDAMNVANATPVPTPTGAEAAATNTAVAQQMAVAASQGAAASSAAGTTAAATAGVVSAASLVSVTSSATVAGVSTVTVGAVGVATGVIPTDFLFPPVQNQCHQFIEEMTARPGYLNLHLEGLPHNFFSINKNTPAIEMAFTDAFNKAIGVCLEHFVEGHNDTNATWVDFDFNSGFYARYMENATLAGWDYWQVVDEDGNTVKYYTTEWTAFVGCDDVGNSGDSQGCSPIEPLFYEGDRPEGPIAPSPSRQLQMLGDTGYLHPKHRWLQDSTLPTQSNLQLFMDTFSQELQELVLKLHKGEVDIPSVYYGESLEVDNAIIVVEREGTRYSGGQLVSGGTPDGAIDRPHGLPSCVLDNGLPSPTVALKEGVVQLSFLGLEQSFVDEHTELLQEEFRSVYNDIMGECEGVFSRVLEKAKLLGVSEWQENGQVLLSTNWTAIVSCDGCEDYEPLFVENEDGAQGSADRAGGRRLEVEEATSLGRFANAFAAAITKQYQKQKDKGTADVYYAAVLDQSLNVVQGAGDKDGPFVHASGALVDCATMKPPTDIDALDGGKFQLSIKDMVKDMNQTILAKVMQDIFNDVSEKCDGPLQRVAHRLTIDSIQQVVVDNTATYVDMNMTTKITCTGCEAIEEPLFLVPDQGAARRHRFLQEALFERFQSKLVTMMNDLLTNFENSDYYEEGAKLFESSDPNGNYPPVTIAYGATYNRNGQVHRHTGQAIHNIVEEPATEEILAGSDIVIAVDVCEKDLKDADATPQDHALQNTEYFAFVKALFASMNEGQSWPQSIGSYDDLPAELQENFDLFAEGGVMTFGLKDESDFDREESRVVRLEAICYYTSHAVQDTIEGVVITEAPTAPPTTEAPTTAATTPEPTTLTEAPTTPATTMAPTVLATAAPTTSSPSQAPTTTPAPTETPVVEITVAWRFNMVPNDRDATDQEYQDLTARVEELLKTNMINIYADDPDYTFEDIADTRFVSNEYYEGAITEDRTYNLAAILTSDFVFRGNQPTARAVFDKFDDLDLKEFGESLWVRDPQPGEEIWVFDNVLGVTVNAVVR